MTEEPRASWLRVLRSEPLLTGVLLACTLAGAVGCLLFLSEDWAAWRRIVGGAMGGLLVGLCILAGRLF